MAKKKGKPNQEPEEQPSSEETAAETSYVSNIEIVDPLTFERDFNLLLKRGRRGKRNEVDRDIKKWRLKQSKEEITAILARGEFNTIKLVPLGSNYTFLATLRDPEHPDTEYFTIYKPMRGEAPLWDFPNGTLYKREYGAYVVSQALNWNFIPPTIIRDGPHGIGTVQLFIDADESVNYYQFRENYASELQRMTVFDIVTNNADRKAGHFLLGADGHLWGIDHGLCFNSVPKLRTVVWDYNGEKLPDDISTDLMEFLTDAKRVSCLRDELAPLLERRELEVFFRRLEQTAEEGTFPSLNSRRQIPWGFF